MTTKTCFQENNCLLRSALEHMCHPTTVTKRKFAYRLLPTCLTITYINVYLKALNFMKKKTEFA